MIAIETTDLTKRDRAGVRLDNVDLTVERGEIVALLGPNGAGKSTLLDLVCGDARPTAGDVSVFGDDPIDERGDLCGRVGRVRARPALDPDRTGLGHVRSAAGAAESAAAAGDTATPMAVLDSVGVGPDTAVRSAGTYAAGTARRVALAAALAGDPDLLVLDDPTAGLDPLGVAGVRSVLRAEREAGTTVLLAVRRLRGLAPLPDRVGLLRDGELVRVADADETTDAPGLTAVTLRVDRVPEVDLEAIPGVEAAHATDETVTAVVSSPAAKPTVVLEVAHSGVPVRDVSLTALDSTTELDSAASSVDPSTDTPSTDTPDR
jgi:ABC-2 type transport system ATP-binding protein